MMGLLAAAVGAPLAHVGLVFFCSRHPLLRDAAHVMGALAVAACCVVLAISLTDANGVGVAFVKPLPNLAIAFAADPLGVVVAATVASLAALCAVYTVGWSRWRGDAKTARFMVFAALSVGSGIAVALAANLFTFFIFYELLVITAFPLLAHAGTEEAKASSARFYLLTILGLGMAALLPAIIWTVVAAGDSRFALGGLLAGRVDPLTANLLFLMYGLGIGLAALFPAHRWITGARGTTPAAAALVFGLVAGLGAFCLLRIAVHVFGGAMQQAAAAATFVLLLSIGTALGASLAAFGRQALTERLGYLCVAQLALVTAGAMLGGGPGQGGEGWFAAALQLIAFMIAAVTLYLAAGAIEAAVGEREIGGLAGFGRRAPYLFTAFAVAGLSFSGAPPLAGAWPKLWLMIAAVNREALWVPPAIALAALAAFGALAAPAAQALFSPMRADRQIRPDGAPALMIVPTLLGGAATFILLFWLDPIARVLAVLRGEAP